MHKTRARVWTSLLQINYLLVGYTTVEKKKKERILDANSHVFGFFLRKLITSVTLSSNR